MGGSVGIPVKARTLSSMGTVVSSGRISSKKKQDLINYNMGFKGKSNIILAYMFDFFLKK